MMYGSVTERLLWTRCGVELAVREGELFAILGGNGVGKTTTLKALTRLVKPYRGTIEDPG